MFYGENVFIDFQITHFTATENRTVAMKNKIQITVARKATTATLNIYGNIFSLGRTSAKSPQVRFPKVFPIIGYYFFPVNPIKTFFYSCDRFSLL